MKEEVKIAVTDWSDRWGVGGGDTELTGNVLILVAAPSLQRGENSSLVAKIWLILFSESRRLSFI